MKNIYKFGIVIFILASTSDLVTSYSWCHNRTRIVINYKEISRGKFLVFPKMLSLSKYTVAMAGKNQ
jgi:hypothetical protein